MLSKKYKVTLNGEVYEVEIEEIINDEITVQEPITINNNDILAPMAGKIVNILVNKGDKVKKGDKLLILEALKMENEITSPTNGEIIAIKVTKGDTVLEKTVLISIG